MGIRLSAALAAFVVHLLGNAGYGFNEEELYLIACGRHPAWGYVEHPPLVPLLAAASQSLGPSLLLLRAVPAAFCAGAVFVSCQLAADMGGKRFAQLLTALAVFFTPVLMAFSSIASTESVGLMMWPLAALCALRVANGGSPRLWLAAGVAIGLSLLAKYTAIFFALALLDGIILTRERRLVASPWFAAGLGVAVAIALPNFLWQLSHDFPMLGLMKSGSVQARNVVVGPAVFLVQQILITGLPLAAVWMIGLYALFTDPRKRFLAWTWVALMVFMAASHAKHYYSADAYPILIAAGAVHIERWTALASVRLAIAAAVTAVGMIFLPLQMAVMSEARTARYEAGLRSLLHIPRDAAATVRVTEQRDGLSAYYADMHGWPELADVVRRAFAALPPHDRERAVVVTRNYGEASALAFFAPELPLACATNQFWWWGPGDRSGEVIVDVGGHFTAKGLPFATVEQVATFTSPWVQPYEDNLPILVCRGLQRPLAAYWPRMKDLL